MLTGKLGLQSKILVENPRINIGYNIGSSIYGSVISCGNNASFGNNIYSNNNPHYIKNITANSVTSDSHYNYNQNDYSNALFSNIITEFP
jgi:hypothetical protein